MTNDVRMALMKLTLECVAGGNDDLPVLRCMERSINRATGDPCMREAGYWHEIPGLGHVVLCAECSHMYSRKGLRTIDPDNLDSRMLAVIIGNLRDQAREVLSATA